MEWSGRNEKGVQNGVRLSARIFQYAKSAMHMASETLSVSAIVFCICLPINRKNKRQFNFLPLVKYLYFIFRITPTIDIEPKKKGFSRIYPHLLRHTFATNFVYNGGNLEVLRVLMGHSTINITQIYIHLAAQMHLVNDNYNSNLDKLLDNKKQSS